jgi:hypothetical protein
MANDVLNVLSGKPLATGGVLRDASNAATLPTDATTALAAGFTALGYIGPDGLTETIDRTTNKIRAWGGDIVKVVQTEFSVTYGFTFYESIRADVLKAVHGDANVTTTAADATHGVRQAVKINSEELPLSQWIFEVKDGDARVRIVVPLGKITAVGEVTYSDESVIGYPVTVEAFRDASGNQAYKYTDDGKTTGA